MELESLAHFTKINECYWWAKCDINYRGKALWARYEDHDNDLPDSEKIFTKKWWRPDETYLHFRGSEKDSKPLPTVYRHHLQDHGRGIHMHQKQLMVIRLY